MHTYSNKCPTVFEPSRHRSKPSPVIRPARARLPRFARGSLCQTLPNSAQKPRRGRRVSVPRPFNGDFDGTNLVEFTHRIPRRRYDRRGGPGLRNSRAHCRAKRVGARAHRPGCPPRFVGRRRARPRASGPRSSLPVARGRPYRSSPALPREYPPSHRPRPPRILPGVRRSPRRKSSLSAEFPRI